MISLLVVNYRAADLAADAIHSARAASSEPLEVVVVDNSCDEGEVERLRPLADQTVAAERNLGYAAAINRGRRLCHGDILIVANPDVVFAPAAIDELAGAIRAGFAAAGPALFWDSAHEWLLPPSDPQTVLEMIDEALATRSAAWLRWRDRRRIEERIEFWSLSRLTRVRAISGAVMAIPAPVFDALDGFDERFELYFEETDFLRRLTRNGRQIAYVPASRCRHIFNQSAGEEGGRTAALYSESERRYLEKWGGPVGSKLIGMLQRPLVPAGALPATGAIATRAGQLVEASPLPSFVTAAGHFARGASVSIPEDVWEAYKSPVLYLRVIDPATDSVVATYARYRT